MPLQAKHPHNIVTVDLPHLPAKTVGPDSAYAMANDTLQSWLSSGVLRRTTNRRFILTRSRIRTAGAPSPAGMYAQW